MKSKYHIAFLAALALPASAIAATDNQAPSITGMSSTTETVVSGDNSTIFGHGRSERERMAVMEKEDEGKDDDGDEDEDEKALAKADAGVLPTLTNTAEKVTKDYKPEKEEDEEGDDDGDEKGEP